MEENNKLIAEFMRKEYNADIDCWKSIQNEKVILEYSNQLLYDTSWNSLMPVISKCAILNNEEGFEPFADICELDLHSEHPTYKEVIRFIKHYNQNK